MRYDHLRFVNIIIGRGTWYEVIATPGNLPFWDVAFLIDGTQQGPTKPMNLGMDEQAAFSILMPELISFTHRRRR